MKNDSAQFDRIRISIASPDDIRGWSRGEVKKPETINYRTFKPERDGLFCEKIFGPIKDWECHCGRYKKMKYKGQVCERCGVEVTRARVRRSRMGHIELVTPVSHIWYLKAMPSPLSLLLDISARTLEKVVYFTSYMVTKVDRRRINQELPALRDALDLILDELVEHLGTDIADRTKLINQEIEEGLARAEEPITENDVKQKRTYLENWIIAQRAEVEEKRIKLRMAFGPSAYEGPEPIGACLEKIEKKQLINDDEWREIERLLFYLSQKVELNVNELVSANMGGAAVKELLEEINLFELREDLAKEAEHTQGQARVKVIKRLEIVDAFINSKIQPSWMVLDCVPVLPPELRPMVQLDGGRFATSDLNDLYRRIINRNNRLRKIIEIRAPESIINHEKRLLQEAVDALIDNGRRSKPVVGTNGRALKSLSDMLKGKEGRFRKNLLGKRVDYSGRSVIVVGPHLKIYQCGLPKEMALELFKPFVMKKLVELHEELGLEPVLAPNGRPERFGAQNIKAAKKMIERMNDQVWDALDEVIRQHPVLLNRAPTLHRLGIQAFEPVLVDGKAIQIHPLVCSAFNADFDGDQMAVHVPLSPMAQAEARVLMLSSQNLFSPANGNAIVAPSQDIVLGSYYLTMANPVFHGHPDDETASGQATLKIGGKETILPYKDIQEAISSYEQSLVKIHKKVLIRMDRGNGPEVVETTIGRVMFHMILPESIAFSDEYMNRTFDKKSLAQLVLTCHADMGHQRTVVFLDDLKDLGFKAAKKSGITIAMTDMDSPPERDMIIANVRKSVQRLDQRYKRLQLSHQQRKSQAIKAWQDAGEEIAKAIVANTKAHNPLFVITDSGARGSSKQLSQLAGMRGLFADARGNLLEDLPITSNFHEGLNVLEYFVSTHGARKGMSDTALRTADAGYLTRRLVDAAQDVIVRAFDCSTTQGIRVRRAEASNNIVEDINERLYGRTALEEITDYITGEVLATPGVLIMLPEAKRIEELVKGFPTLSRTAPEQYAASVAHFQEMYAKGVLVRSPLTCAHSRGICSKCYGLDLATRRFVEIGTAVGIIAAESIGEPGTQLTMRTFHTGGGAGSHLAGGKQSFNSRLTLLEELRLDFSQQKALKLTTGEDDASIPMVVNAKEIRDLMDTYISPAGSLPRVIDLFMATEALKGRAIMSDVAGEVMAVETRDLMREVVIASPEPVTESGDRIIEKYAAEDVQATSTQFEASAASNKKQGVIVEKGKKVTASAYDMIKKLGISEVKIIKTYRVPGRGELKANAAIYDKETGELTKAASYVEPGDALTEGLLQPRELLRLKGVAAVQEYLVQEIQKVYKQQGVDIHDKHLEVIVRQMLKKRRVLDPGDTRFLPGRVIDKFLFDLENHRVRDLGGKEATAEWVLQSITESALTTESFLSAASFERTTHVLTEAAVRGKRDDLVGLKENVIIGRLIPSGTGYQAYRKLDVQPLMEGEVMTPEMYDPILAADIEAALLAEDLALLGAADVTYAGIDESALVLGTDIHGESMDEDIVENEPLLDEFGQPKEDEENGNNHESDDTSGDR